MKWLWLSVAASCLTFVAVILSTFSTIVFAAQSQSNSYQVNEVEFGAGGLTQAGSSHYSAQENLGNTTGGTTKSPSYWAEAGYLTPNEPFLEMVVTPANINLGTLSTSSTSTGTASFNVRSYTDGGYTVVTANNPPSQEEGKTLRSLISPTASSSGSEQFGMNLVANTTGCSAPANFGANPSLIPNSAYANGQAASGYNTCGLFKYSKGDVIAESGSNGWGETDYTISYIANISTITYSGVYKLTQDLVAVATY